MSMPSRWGRARSNPRAETRVVVTGGWADKAKEAAATNALVDQGADVVTPHARAPLES
jgi:basic membrane protein A and related proteins